MRRVSHSAPADYRHCLRRCPRSGRLSRARRPLSPPSARAAARSSKDATTKSTSLTDKLDLRDPNVVAIRARGMIARGRYRMPRRAAACRAAGADERSGARTRPAGAIADAAGRRWRPSSAWPRWRTRALTAGEVARAARALRALGRFQEANAAYREAAAALRRATPPSRPPGASCSSKSTTRREALKSFQMALQADPRWTPALVGVGARARRRQPAAGDRRSRSARSKSIRPPWTRTFPRRARRRRGQIDEARQSVERALGSQSVQPRRARAARCARVRARTNRASSKRRSRRRLRLRRTTATCIASPAKSRRATTGSTRRSRSRVARSRSTRTTRRRWPTSASQLLRTGDEAGRTRGAGQRRSRSTLRRRHASTC